MERGDITIVYYQFVDTWNEDEGFRHMSECIKEAWENPIFKDDPYMQAFYTQFTNVRATPKIPEWEQIAFSKVQQYAELSVRNAMSIEDALENLDKDVNRILEKRRWLVEQKRNN